MLPQRRIALVSVAAACVLIAIKLVAGLASGSLGLLAEAGELEVRIGITTGEALITLDARPEAGEGIASGDVVNTAARLQAAAAPGSILVDEATHRATASVIEYASTDAVAAKGKADPVGAWEAVLARLPVGAEQLGAAELVGRERELVLLQEGVDRALREREPGLVTLVGVPGIGKTRLVRELHAIVQEGSFGSVTWLRGRSLPYGEDLGFWAFREIVKAQAGILETDSREAAAAKLASSVDGLPLDASEADWVRRHLAPLLGFVAQREGEDRRPERFAAWRRFVEGLARTQPVVLVVEDLHWADDGLLDFVASLAEWLSDLPVFAVATARPELLERRPGWGASERVTVLTLEPLSDDATSELIGQLLAISQLAPEVRSALLEQAGGNPLYAEQYVRMVSEHGVDHAVPGTVQALIVARLDGLPEIEKRVAQDASVTGGVFWTGAVAAAGEHDRWTVDEHLRALERKAFVRRPGEASVAGETEWAFGHALVREAAYAAIPRASRAEKHLRVAAWIESLQREDDHSELLAHHYFAALDLAGASGLDLSAVSVRALAAARQAAKRAHALHAFAAAARLYRRALDLLPADHPARAPLQLELGRSLFLSGAGGEDELLAAGDALRSFGDLEGATEAEMLLADLYRDSGEQGLYEKHLAVARSLAGELDPSSVKAHALLAISADLNRRGHYEQALVAGLDALAQIEDLGSVELRARALNVIGWARLETDDDGGLADFEQSVELACSLGSPVETRGHANLAHHLRHRGDFRRSLEHLEEALRLADRFGDVPTARFLRGILPHNRYREGRWDEALEAAESYLDEVGDSHFHVWHALGTRGLIRLSRGDGGGIEDSDRSIEAARRSVDPTTLPATLEVRMRSLVLAGRPDEALQIMEEALGILETGIVRAGFDLPHLVFAAVELDQDGQRVLAVARPSKWEEAARCYFAGDFGRAADIYGEAGSRTDESEARLRSGGALLAAGRRSEGEAELARALAFYRDVRASYFVRRGEDMLASAGLEIPA